MMTNKKRMLMAMRGEKTDVIPFVPRLDLWFNGNKLAGTLPEKYKNATHHFEIARSEGWGIHQINPAYQDVRSPEDNLHWALGILSFKESVYGYRFNGDVDIKITKENDKTHILYQTPKGNISTTIVFTEQMRKMGISAYHIEEYAIKGVEDYPALGYIFENIELYPDWKDFVRLQEEIGEDGVAFTLADRAASPMHHIQKYFIDATDFFFQYKDFHSEMNWLAEQMNGYYEQLIDVIGQSPAEAVYWGANFDDMITYPDYFERDILPWIKRASKELGAKGKIVSCHCDGENRQLMDLLYQSDMHIAESVCPFPMTKVKIGEYYARWSDKLTIFGGIPSNLLLPESTSDAEFKAYMDELFASVAPGYRMIFGVADSTPPGAKFERLVEIGKRVATEATLPITAEKKISGQPAGTPEKVGQDKNKTGSIESLEEYGQVKDDILAGDHIAIIDHVDRLLKEGASASNILQRGMLPSMEVIGQRFKDGTVFIPEVLMSARAMNLATEHLEPYLGEKKTDTGGKILIGTVHGDLHDIGKNIVATMLKGVGYEVIDIGINIHTDEFIRQVEEHQPKILALSALLTTTMPEMENVIHQIERHGLHHHVKVIVGGAPVNQKFAQDIGADGYASDAGQAVEIVRRFF